MKVITINGYVLPETIIDKLTKRLDRLAKHFDQWDYDENNSIKDVLISDPILIIEWLVDNIEAELDIK